MKDQPLPPACSFPKASMGRKIDGRRLESTQRFGNSKTMGSGIVDADKEDSKEEGTQGFA